jgi:hypothetical protein
MGDMPIFGPQRALKDREGPDASLPAVSPTLPTVDLAARRIFVVKGKGDKDRIVIFPPRVQELLTQFIRPGNPDAWLFASPCYRGRRRCLEWVSSVLTRWARGRAAIYVDDAPTPAWLRPHVQAQGRVLRCCCEVARSLERADHE